MGELLSDEQIAEFCQGHARWQRDGDSLITEVKAPTFLEGIDYVTAVAQAAEEMDHHPDIDIRWRTLTFRLSTHSRGGITDLDTALAERINAIVGVLP
ncbi:MAG: 4a-hydroxytetrahydrobiopterin dehydratase [Ilumatobacteraceae bacterium]